MEGTARAAEGAQHFNALFVTDAEALRTPDLMEALRRGKSQGGPVRPVFVPLTVTLRGEQEGTYAIIRRMKRTTIFVEDQLERELQAIARRKDRPMASVVREALEQYVVAVRREAQPRLGFIAAGRSGHGDTAERHEELLFRPEGGRERRGAKRARPRG